MVVLQTTMKYWLSITPELWCIESICWFSPGLCFLLTLTSGGFGFSEIQIKIAQQQDIIKECDEKIIMLETERDKVRQIFIDR
jgi:hypothetical protein